MKTGLYRKLAWENIRKNYRFFVPRILTEMGLLACIYICATLTGDDRITEIRGGDYVTSFMAIGTVILCLLTVILMLYTNSFLMKQRKREFGLYNVLGMEKRHVGRILFHETMICSAVSVALGLGLGILMYKLCSLLICKLLQAEIILGFYYIRADGILPVILIFLGLDLFIYLLDRISIARMKPVELLQSKSAGEREPKTKWVMLIIGLVTMVLGYGISVTVESPLRALQYFFVAVVLVIIGTYFLFVSGSIFVLKALKKSKAYYYQKNHFATVSGLIYRMKQNAVGLASIAILATGVLVMISTTVSLYSSMEDTLKYNYPQEVYVQASTETETGSVKFPTEALMQAAEDAAAPYGLEISAMEHQRYLEVTFSLDGVQLGTDLHRNDTKAASFLFLTEEMFTELTGERLNLAEDEFAICPVSGTKPIMEDHLELEGKRFDIAKELASFPVKTTLISNENYFGTVVANGDVLQWIFRAQQEAYGDNASDYTDRIAVKFADRDAYESVGYDYQDSLFDELIRYVDAQGEGNSLSAYVDSLVDSRESLVGMYGTFLFLGIILGLVCLFATALIVYYKQISEGYEDRDRFQIMKKVGMSDGEVKSAIRTQILLVFFLPLLVSGVHLCAAFPMLEKLMHLLMLSSTTLFVLCSVAVFLAFAAVYVIIYSVTAKTYYKIIR